MASTDGGETQGGLAVRYRPPSPAGSDLLVVVFSQVRVPAGKFGLERLFANTRHACLFLNQPENRWYRSSDATIDAAITDALVRSGAGKMVLYGSSMGAFGALRTAPRWPAARVVAFAPDFRVGEAGSRSAEAGLSPEPGEGDLDAFLAAPREGRIDIAIGLFDGYDASVAVRLAGLDRPWLELVPLASSHEVHDHLYSVNVIRKVIGGFVRDLAGEVKARGLLIPVEDWGPYAAFARLATRLHAGERIAPAEAEALALSGNPGVELLKAELARRNGDERRAIALLEELGRQSGRIRG